MAIAHRQHLSPKQPQRRPLLPTAKWILKPSKTSSEKTCTPQSKPSSNPPTSAPWGLADFYQTIIHSYIAKSKCSTFIDAFSNCVFPWTHISYIHFPYLNQYAFSQNLPIPRQPTISLKQAPYRMFYLEKNLIDYKKRLGSWQTVITRQEKYKSTQTKPPKCSIRLSHQSSLKSAKTQRKIRRRTW